MMEKQKRRVLIEIVFDLLKNTRKPIKKTRLQGLTRISGIDKYLSNLLERGLVKEIPYVSDRGRRMSKITPYLYVITEKGVEFIGLFERLYEILGIDGG